MCGLDTLLADLDLTAMPISLTEKCDGCGNRHIDCCCKMNSSPAPTEITPQTDYVHREQNE